MVFSSLLRCLLCFVATNFLLNEGVVVAFTTTKLSSISSPTTTTTQKKLHMAPKYNTETERWEPTTTEDKEGGYDIFETVVRNGPIPFFQRVSNGDSYEQGILKMMATYGMGRKEAQGNMDASLENQADWLYQKMEEKNGAPKKDYAKSPTAKQYYLALAWTCIVFWFFGSITIDIFNGKYFT